MSQASLLLAAETHTDSLIVNTPIQTALSLLAEVKVLLLNLREKLYNEMSDF